MPLRPTPNDSLTDRPSEYFPWAAAALSGFVVCIGIAAATGRREAWDSSVYFSLGIPLMCLAIFAIAYAFPGRAWRWTLSMAAGQSAAMLMAGNSLSLWPLSLVAMTIYSAPQFVFGFAASRLARRKAGP
jgi:hypothetical protein